MLQAPLTIADQVTSQLVGAVRESTNAMTHYPALREEVDRIVRNWCDKAILADRKHHFR